MTQKIIGSPSKFATSKVSVPGGATATKVADARPGRKAIIINLSNAGTSHSFYFGADSNVDASNGFALVLGEMVTLETESEVWAIRPTATDPISVTIAETFDDV
jgi:hypothetical protein